MATRPFPVLAMPTMKSWCAYAGRMSNSARNATSYKSARHLLADARVSAKYQFVAAQASQYAVALLCRVLGVARSGYYAWRQRTESPRSRTNRTLTDQIRTVHRASRGTYGSPRIHAELRALGLRCARTRVARLMRLSGVWPRSPGACDHTPQELVHKPCRPRLVRYVQLGR